LLKPNKVTATIIGLNLFVTIYTNKSVQDGLLSHLNFHLKNYEYGVLLVCLPLGALLSYYSQYRSARYDKVRENLCKFLLERCHELQRAMGEHSENIRINIFYVRRKLFSYLHPLQFFRESAKTVRLNAILRDIPFLRVPKVFGKVFDLVVATDNMTKSPDRNLKMSVQQGVTGIAYRKGNYVEGVLSDPEVHKTACFTKKQRKLTGSLLLILSCPILELNGEKNVREEVPLGIVNLDSSDRKFFEQFQADEAYRKTVRQSIEKLADICSEYVS
jgi:hypothetical protein